MPNQLWADAFVVRRAKTKEAWRYIKTGWNVWRGGNREQRAGASPGKTEEVQGQESCHRTQSLQASVPLTLGKESRKKIKWPPAYNKGAWQDFDNDICEIIQSATKGDVENRLSFMTTIITSLASERFVCVEPLAAKDALHCQPQGE